MKGDRLYQLALKKALMDDVDLDEVFTLLMKAKKVNNYKATYALATWYLFGTHVKKNVYKAFELLFEAAEHNVAEACFDIAISYEKGIGTPKNLNEAFLNYMKAALLGDKKSIYEVGRLYYYGIGIEKDRQLAKVWFDMADFYGISE